MEQSIKYLLGHLYVSVELHIVLHSPAVSFRPCPQQERCPTTTRVEGLGGSHQVLQGMEATAQQLPGSGAGKGPVSLDELQQASCSLANT